MDEPQQLDLFNDFDKARVFTLTVGCRVTRAFVGRLRPDSENPVERQSIYFADETQAAEALSKMEKDCY